MATAEAKKPTEGDGASLARLRAILETAVDAIVTIDADGVIQAVNPAATRIFGYDRDELIGRNVSVLMAEPDRTRHDGYLARHLTTGEAHIIGTGREVTGRHRDGSHLPVHLSVSRSDVDDVTQFTGIIRDLRTHKMLEASVRGAEDEAERANKAKSVFLSSMTHELRTPLNAILGFGELILNDARHPLPTEHQLYMDNIMESAQHLLTLVNNVLDLSKIDSGKIDVALRDTDLRSLIDDGLTLTRMAAEKSAIKVVDATRGRPLPAVRADFVRVKQVLLNLLSNAVQYNSAGGTVTVDVAEDGDGVRVSVEDTGVGVPVERHAEVFERFNRLDQQHGAIGGTGIGLSIARELIDMMGGAIGFTSQPGDGSTFWFRLPRATATVLPFRAAPRTVEPRKVLYLEDNPSNLRLMEHLFGEIDGYILISASTVDWASEIMDVWEPDVIMLEIDSDGSRGRDRMDRLRRHPSARAVPIVAVVGSEDDIAGCADVFRCLATPLHLDDVRQALAAANAASAAARQVAD